MDSGQANSGARMASLQAMKTSVNDLLNLYLGRSILNKPDDEGREIAFQLRKRITSFSTDLPPRNEQFLLDFQQLQSQFSDQEQLCHATESVLLSLIVQCSSHTLQAEFLLFALQTLSNLNLINWDSFVCSLLSTASIVEPSGQSNQALANGSASSSRTMNLSMNTPNLSVAHMTNPSSPLGSFNVIGSPPHGAIESTNISQSPVKISDQSYSSHQMSLRGSSQSRGSAIWSCLRQLVCKVVLIGLEQDLKPATHADVFTHMVDWIINWNPRKPSRIDEHDIQKLGDSDQDSRDWLRGSLEVIWVLVDETKCRIPFYELLHSGIQFVNNVPDDEALFTLVLEIHRRRDKIATHMQMLDQHLHCPTFATLRIAPQSYSSAPAEPMPSLKSAPLTYPSVLGEPLYGEEIVNTIQKGSMDWERALRCLRHALRSMPCPEWWRRVLFVAPCYRQIIQLQPGVVPGIIFSAEMICEATIDRIMELMQAVNAGMMSSSTSNVAVGEENIWPQWLSFADLFFFLMKNGYIDFLSFVDKLASRCSNEEQQIVRTNHVTWLLTQVLRIESLSNLLVSDPKKMEMARKFLCLHKEERSSDQNSSNSAQSILLDFISSCQILLLWRLNLRENINNELLQKGRQIDEWWKQNSKGLDYMNLDEKSMGMFWVLSHTTTQPACDALMGWLNSPGFSEVIIQTSMNQPNEQLTMMRETRPLPMPLLSGLSVYMCNRLVNQMEEAIFTGQFVPSIALLETYVRLQLLAPHTIFRPHYTLLQKCQSASTRTGVHLLLLEILNYRLIPLYRYHGKIKALIYDHSKIIALNKSKRGEHRLFRLAENLCINLILCLRDVIPIKKDMKTPTDFTETLNRILVINLAITIKTRGIAEFEQMVLLGHVFEQILATTNYTWSEKTMRYFPHLLRESLNRRAGEPMNSRSDRRGQVIQAWQQAEATVLNQCQNLLSLSADSNYLATYLRNSFPQHRQYLCAGAWMLMDGHPEGINSANLGRVLKELSPEEVTSNIYIMVDVILHHIQLQLQRGHIMQDLLLNASIRLALLLWTHELLPFDIVLLALIDRDDDPAALRLVVALLLDRQEFQQRVTQYCINRGNPDHWVNHGPFQHVDPQQALGNHLAGKDRYPVFFDDMAMRALPVIQLIVYRLIENDATETAEKLLATYTKLLFYHPCRFTFVREILAYFHGHIPPKLVMRILSILDIVKIPFSEQFFQYLGSSNSGCPPAEYFQNLLLGLVNNVIPPVRSTVSQSFSFTGSNRSQATSQSFVSSISDNQKVFYQNQDPGTYKQLLLETAVIEILSLPPSISQIVSTLVQIVGHTQPIQVQSTHSVQNISGVVTQTAVHPTSPSAATADSVSTSRSNTSSGGLNAGTGSGINSASPDSSALMIQACGLLFSQLPLTFQIQFYMEAARVIKECWWLMDATMTSSVLECAFGYALWDPSWAIQDSTSTTIGNIIALLHATFSNLPHEWLEATHTIIQQMRPITTIAQLRIAFRIMGPLLSRLGTARALFKKTLALLFSILADVFGRNSQTSVPVNPTEISDLIDFLHHAVLYEAQGSTQNGAKPKPDTLSLCSKAVEHLHPELQHLLRHLTTDPNSSIYAATHPKMNQRPPSPLQGMV